MSRESVRMWRERGGRAAWVVAAVLAAPSARAAAPDHVAKVYDFGGGTVAGLKVSSDDVLVAGTNGNGRVVVIDTETWTGATVTTCDARSVEVQPRAERDEDTSAVGYYVYVGCGDGTVETWRWFNDNLREFETTTSTSGADTDANGADSGLFGGGTSSSATGQEVFNVGQNAVVGLYLWNNELHAVLEPDGGLLNVRTVDLLQAQVGGGVDICQSGITCPSGFEEAVIVAGGVGGAPLLYINHGAGSRRVSDFSTYNLATRTPITTLGLAGASAVGADDITPGDNGGILFSDADRGIGSYLSAGLPAVFDGVTQNVTALVVTTNASGAAFEYLVGQQAGRIQVWTSPAGRPLVDPLETFAVDFTSRDLVEGPWGYVFAGTDDGSIAVLTANPFVDELTVTPSVGLEGTEVEVSFLPDTTGTWTLSVGGDRDSGGQVVLSGSVTEVGRVVERFVLDGRFVEGDNDVWLRFTSTDGLDGAARATVTIDNPPDAVLLNAGSLGFADGALVLTFNALAALDVARYEIYIRDRPFNPDNYETGGPVGQVTSGVTSPITVTAEEGVGRISQRIEPLENNVVYYVAVRAVDQSDQESAMSSVVSGMPRPTLSAVELSGEQGGCEGCASSGGGAGGLGALAGLVGLLARRRRRGAVAAALVGGVVASSAAHAQDRRRPAILEQDTTPAWANFEFRWGMFSPQDSDLKAVYGDRSSEFRLSAGPQIFRFVELDFGVGVFSRRGTKVDSAQNASAEEIRFEMLPLSAAFTGRVHVIDEQPIVPFASVGIDYVFWRETDLDTERVPIKTSRITGSKGGWHWQAGGQILLDWLAPRRASILEASSGINDTWLTIAYHRQYIGQDDAGLDLSGWSIQVGLQLDY